MYPSWVRDQIPQIPEKLVTCEFQLTALFVDRIVIVAVTVVNSLWNINLEVCMKILISVLVVLLLGLAGAGWMLKVSWNREGELEQSLAGVQGALEQAEGQNRGLTDRFDTLDQTLVGLGKLQQQNQLALSGKLNAIKNIVAEPGDSDASISCLDVRVPAQLDRSLR